MIARIFTLVPFIGVLVLVYYLITLVAGGPGWIDGSFYTFGSDLEMNNGEAITLLGLLLLAIEVMKSTNTKGFSLANHGLSMFVLIIAVVLFLTVPDFSTVPFLMITAMALVDVMSMIVTIITARRDIGLGGFDAG